MERRLVQAAGLERNSGDTGVSCVVVRLRLSDMCLRVLTGVWRTAVSIQSVVLCVYSLPLGSGQGRARCLARSHRDMWFWMAAGG